MFGELLPLEAYALFLIFARVGAFLLLMPTIGEAYISPRIRLGLALGITLVIAPVALPLVPPEPPSGMGLALLVMGEVLVGLFLGQIMRVFMAGLSTAGTIIAFQTGFSNALLFNPAMSDQGALPAVFLTLLGTLLVLVTDTHHLMLMALVDSYRLFEPGMAPMPADMLEMLARKVADSFLLGIQLSAPFIVVITLFNVLLGVLSRLMPQLQIFFLALPAQIMLGLGVFLVTLPAMMMWFLDSLTGNIGMFIQLN